MPPLIVATSALVFFQQPRQLGEIEPPPAAIQACEEFELAARENRHRRDTGFYFFCIPAYCMPLKGPT